MENVHVVVGIGCTPVVKVFSNREAAEMCKAAFDNDYTNAYLYTVDVLEDYSKYVCPRCGSTLFRMTWKELMSATFEYDPADDNFNLYRSSEPGDNTPEDIDIECDSCGASVTDEEGDLEERMFENL